MRASDDWARLQRWYCASSDTGIDLDVSRIGLTDAVLDALGPGLERAFRAMAELERGAIANPDENRRVGHYWLRDADLAPDAATASAIRDTVERIRSFADAVHRGAVRPERAERFARFLVIGIGGSALGPQLVADALGRPDDRMIPSFLDNTDPDGIDRLLATLGPDLARTLVIVISKSGGTPETRNGMLEVDAAYGRAGLAFARHAVVVTGEGSALDRYATERRFVERFPMWDWVGGRTSETSVVGLLPAALQGIDVRALLDGAAAMDRETRRAEPRRNPAALLAVAWHHVGNGHGAKDMVILPYKDRLALLSRYLQQLVMESLGKARDLEGRLVEQGIAVYGNKGSTDQHAYVQQLRDGLPNFFVTFVRVLRDGPSRGIDVEPGTTSGDYLNGLLLGTRRALWENGRPSLTITIDEVTPRTVGALIALYERAVGLYASLIGVNAYHQPGVEAGKKAAAEVLELQRRIERALAERPGGGTAEAIAAAVGAPADVETVFHVLEHLAANPGRGVSRSPGADPFSATYRRDDA
jgi:glucose-6-phosphate isomerase